MITEDQLEDIMSKKDPTFSDYKKVVYFDIVTVCINCETYPLMALVERWKKLVKQEHPKTCQKFCEEI
jgi:hypothetical protein